MRVYNFTSENFAISNIFKRRMKISLIDNLNDPFELTGLRLSNKEYRKIFKLNKAEFARRFGILCFSKSWGNPVLWSHYGDKHKGICLGFDVPDTLLRDVEYFGSKKSMEAEIKINENCSEELFRELAYRKFSDWSYEGETRIIIGLDTSLQDGELYFSPFSNDLALREIIIGPRNVKKPIDMAQLMRPLSYSDVEIIKSRLAFDSYRVIPNRRYKITKI